MLNMALLRNPLNWIIVFLMVLIGLFLANTAVTFVQSRV
jgi:hypothetical protein